MIIFISTLLTLFLAAPVSASEQDFVASNTSSVSSILPYHEVRIDEDLLNNHSEHEKQYSQKIKLSDHVHGYFVAQQRNCLFVPEIQDIVGKLVLVSSEHLPNTSIDPVFLPDHYIAFTNFTINPGYKETPSVVHLDYIETHSNHRQKGHATSMVKTFIEIMKNSQMDYLTTSARTTYSERTFQKCGFQRTGDSKPSHFPHDTNHFLKLKS